MMAELEEMAHKQPMEPAYLSISKFLDNEYHPPPDMITPIQLADSLESLCQKALTDVRDIQIDKNLDLLYEVSDIKA
jgi:hypothetical protein